MQEAAEVLDWAKISIMEILRETAVADCAQQCEGMWLQCAYEVITNSNIQPDVFAAALGDRIEDRCGNYHRPSQFWENHFIGTTTNCLENV